MIFSSMSWPHVAVVVSFSSVRPAITKALAVLAGMASIAVRRYSPTTVMGDSSTHKLELTFAEGRSRGAQYPFLAILARLNDKPGIQDNVLNTVQDNLCYSRVVKANRNRTTVPDGRDHAQRDITLSFTHPSIRYIYTSCPDNEYGVVRCSCDCPGSSSRAFYIARTLCIDVFRYYPEREGGVRINLAVDSIIIMMKQYILSAGDTFSTHRSIMSTAATP